MQLGLANGPCGYDSGTAWMTKSVPLNTMGNISLRMYCSAYSHDYGWYLESMSSGIIMSLYDANGHNYANYTYWLACWYENTNNRSAPNGYTKVIFGQPAMNKWINLTFNPTTDWSINWSKCDKVMFQLYTTGAGTNGDYLTLYFDDFSYTDAPANHQVKYSYNSKNGDLLSTTDPLGLKTSYQYDLLGRVTRTNDTDGTSHTTNTYNDAQNTVTIYDELGLKTVNYYDELGRLKQSVRYGLSGTPYSNVTSTYTWEDKVKTQTDAVGRVTKYYYDYLGRLTCTQYMNGTTFAQTSTVYDDMNRTVTNIDALGHMTVWVNDYMGRLNATRECYSSTAFYQTLMTYDAVGDILTTKQANGDVTRLTYDTLDRTSSATYPDQTTNLWTYDNEGRTTNTTAGNGTVETSAYDTTGAVIRNIGTSGTVRTKYDGDGNVIMASNSLGNITYTFNNRSLVSKMVENINGTSYSFGYSYNAAGELLSTSYPDLTSITNVYDNYNMIPLVRDGKHTAAVPDIQ